MASPVVKFVKRGAGKFASEFTEKTAPVSADVLIVEDSEDSGSKKNLQIGNLPAPFTLSRDVNDAIFPSSNPARGGSRNGRPILSFDDTVAESAIVKGVAPASYKSASNISVRIDWTASSATTGGVTWGLELEAIKPGTTDIDSDSFDTQKTGNSTTHATNGIETRTTITLSNAEADVIAAGEGFRLRIQRVVGDAGDTMIGFAEIVDVSLVQ